MSDETHIDGAISKVIQAVGRFGKSRLAAKAGLRESSIRNADREGWNPTREVLRKLEIAASQLESEHGPADAAGQRESSGQVPPAAVTA